MICVRHLVDRALAARLAALHGGVLVGPAAWPAGLGRVEHVPVPTGGARGALPAGAATKAVGAHAACVVNIRHLAGWARATGGALRHAGVLVDATAGLARLKGAQGLGGSAGRALGAHTLGAAAKANRTHAASVISVPHLVWGAGAAVEATSSGAVLVGAIAGLAGLGRAEASSRRSRGALGAVS